MDIKSQEIIDEVMSPVKPQISPMKNGCEGPYLTNKIQASTGARRKTNTQFKSPFLNQSNNLSDITEIPELRFQLEQANRMEKEFEKLVMDRIDKLDYNPAEESDEKSVAHSSGEDK